MYSQNEVMERIVEKVSQRVVESITATIVETVERELSDNLTRSLVESEFYRRLTDDMHGGLQTIYKEIAEAAKPSQQASASGKADALFNEASQQLDDILATTEEATESIMDVVEKHMALQSQADELLAGLRKTRKSNPSIHRLIEINDELGENLTHIMTALSFQDLTGQRIKRIINALKTIETTVFELYVSTGLTMKARENAPDKDFEEIKRESKAKASQLKGPQRESSQADVDDLLAQLGMD